MPRDVIALIDVGQETDLHIVQARHRPKVVEAAFAQCAPKALHLAACLGVVGLGVHERDTEPRAHCLERVARIGSTIVEVERGGGWVQPEGFDQ